MKIRFLFPTALLLAVASVGVTFSACSQNAAVNNSAANAASKPNTAVVVNSNQTAINNAATPASNKATEPRADKKSTAATPAEADAENSKFTGELQVGKTESLILYVGMESGDYAAYCFANDSEAGRAILAGCKNKGQCEVTGTSEGGKCEVPGLEANLSDSGRITKVVSAEPLPLKK